MNRQKVGQDLKLQWNLMMQEFEQSAKKQLSEPQLMTPEQLKQDS